MERLREVNSYLNKENKGLHKVVEVMQRADRLKVPERSWFLGKFKNRYRNADFEQYKKSFNPSDMITICMPTTKCKNHEIDDLYL